MQKVNSHSGLSKYGWWGPLSLVQKVKPTQWGTQYAVGMQYTVGMQYVVGMQYAVGVSA